VSAETIPASLRRAAKLMRERAETASQGPWKSWLEGRDHEGGDSFIQTAGTWDLVIGYESAAGDHGWVKQWDADQDYIAAMHPLVAAAVADLLDKIAMDPDMLGRVGCDEAIAIARAYLGETGADLDRAEAVAAIDDDLGEQM
jgi:hypothetical protein